MFFDFSHSNTSMSRNGAAVMRCSSRSHFSHRLRCTPIVEAIWVWLRPRYSRASLGFLDFIKFLIFRNCYVSFKVFAPIHFRFDFVSMFFRRSSVFGFPIFCVSPCRSLVKVEHSVFLRVCHLHFLPLSLLFDSIMYLIGAFVKGKMQVFLKKLKIFLTIFCTGPELPGR